jgi:hypothetical protein
MSQLLPCGELLAIHHSLPKREHITFPDGNSGSSAVSNLLVVGKENVGLGVAAIQQALMVLDEAPVTLTQLDLYFIASHLFESAGNNVGLRECNRILEKCIRSCEQNQLIDEKQIMAASSILDSMADCVIYVDIPNEGTIGGPSMYVTKIGGDAFTEADFKKCEKLKLRALAMVDRLDAKNHLRRMAHRNLTLWYTRLGKTELAEKQKQTLFDLVGIRDDRILQPISQGCGHVIWWQDPSKRSMGGYCGMG